MSSNIEDQDFWPMLAYSAQQQAKELIKLKRRLTRMLYLCLIAAIIGVIYFAPYIFGKIKFSSIYMFPLFIFLLILYFVVIYISAVKKEFDDVKKHAISFIENEGCSCMDKYCPHKDQYIKFMSEMYHINLSF